ncbi:MAG: hypothetical protein ACE5GE_06640 [Phycisphaerae bacterium]
MNTDPQSQPSSIPPQRHSRFRRLIFRCLALAGAVTIPILLGEALLWFVAPIPYHEWMIWESEGHIRARPMPNQSLHNASGHLLHINKYGFRGPDYSYRKPPGTLRIEVFGGSAGFCFEASGRAASWPGALEQKLAKRLEMPVEVINLSLPGFDSFNSKFNYLCFGRAFQPDAVIVYHTWNDMKQFRDLANRPYAPAASVTNKPLWQRVARETQLGRRARNFLWARTMRQMENTFRVSEGTEVGIDAPVDEKAFAWERQNFLDLANLVQSDNRLAILVSQPGLIRRSNLTDPDIRFTTGNVPVMVGMTIPLAVDSWKKVTTMIEDVASETGAIFVDGYGAVPSDLEHFHDVVHLRDAGSEVLAEKIATTLLADERFEAAVQRVRAERNDVGESGGP